jgi:TldD protein
VGRGTSKFSEVEPVVDTVGVMVKKDPTLVPLAKRKALLDEYNDLVWSIPKIHTSQTMYIDARRHFIIANSTGSYIEQSRVDMAFRISAIARDGGDVQQAGVSVGSSCDFGAIEGIHSEVEEVARKSVELLSAPQAKAGEYTVVLDPILAGVFTHEAFGHLSESDFIYENKQMQEIMVLGRRFGGEHLNIVDDPSMPGLRGSYKYDDEGTPPSKNYLIKGGVLVGRLHSRETAAKMGEAPTGNARTIGYRYPPIVRMSNTFIEPGTASFDDLIADIKDGIYAKSWYGGTTAMEMFTFSAQEAYRIRNGRVEELLRPVVLSGNVFATLQNIDGIGNDLGMNQGGGCGKGEQSPLPVSNGAPHIRIQKCLVSGS